MVALITGKLTLVDDLPTTSAFLQSSCLPETPSTVHKPSAAQDVLQMLHSSSLQGSGQAQAVLCQNPCGPSGVDTLSSIASSPVQPAEEWSFSAGVRVDSPILVAGPRQHGAALSPLPLGQGGTPQLPLQGIPLSPTIDHSSPSFSSAKPPRYQLVQPAFKSAPAGAFCASLLTDYFWSVIHWPCSLGQLLPHLQTVQGATS